MKKLTKKTGVECTTEWWRGDTLFWLMRPKKELCETGKRPKFTHRIGRFADPLDPEIDPLRDEARVTFGAEVAALLGELRRKKADAAARGDSMYPITFGQAVDDYCAQATIKTLSDRKSQLKRLAVPALGKMMIASMDFKDVNAVLESAKKKGLREQTVKHLRNAIAAVLTFIYGREQIPTLQPFDRVRLPAFDKAKQADARPRVQLTDAEFAKFVGFEEAPLELRTLAMTSRCLGGMRTSDLHALCWEHVDRDTWADAFIPRPKTEESRAADPSARHEIPAVLAPFLKRWWLSCGRPQSGAVFGAQRARRAGKGAKGARKGRGISYAQALREWLLKCGVKRHEVHNDTTITRKTDFHSFRRSYATALGRSGTNAQESMKLAGHSDIKTHLKYVNQATPARCPEAALPVMPTPTLMDPEKTG